MIVKIKKDYFKTMPEGTHDIVVNYNDGYANGIFKIGKKITFTILGETFSATEGMSWADWIMSYGIGASGNNILWVGFDNNSLFIDHRYHPSWDNGSSLGSEENRFYDSNDVEQTLSTTIINGASYGRESGAPT